MTQTESILKHLKRGPITPIEALERYGCFRLGARIYDLRAAGHQIRSKTIKRNGKAFAEYSLT